MSLAQVGKHLSVLSVIGDQTETLKVRKYILKNCRDSVIDSVCGLVVNAIKVREFVGGTAVRGAATAVRCHM